MVSGCETWTLLSDSEKKKRSRLLKPPARGNFSTSPTWGTRLTTGWGGKINFLVGPEEPLLATVKRQKLMWFKHVTCHKGYTSAIFQGIFEDGQPHDWHRQCWMDIIPPELFTRASCRKDWKRISTESILGLCPLVTQSVKGLNWTELIWHIWTL